MTKEAEWFTLRLTWELKEQLDENRKHRGVSLNALVVQILRDWAEQQSKSNINRRFDKADTSATLN